MTEDERLRRLLPGYDPSDDLREVQENFLEVSAKFWPGDEIHDDDDLWDRADAEQDAVFEEKYQFLDALEARGPASTPEQLKHDIERFREIQKRCNARAKAIFERVMAGYPPTN